MRDVLRNELQAIRDTIARLKNMADAASRASDAREERELQADIAEYQDRERELSSALSHEQDWDVLFAYAHFKKRLALQATADTTT